MALNLRSLSSSLPTLTRTRTIPPQCIHARSISILSSISDNPGAYGHPKRVGRGPSSGKGKTSGRGHKGQKQHGKVPAGFEGGQTPIRFTEHQIKYGNVHRQEYAPVPLTRILSWIAQGRIDPSKPITPRELLTSRCVHEITDGIKLLSSSLAHNASVDEIPPLTMPLHIVVSRASASAIAAVEAAGGSVVTRYYTNFALRNIVKGNMDPMHSLLSLAAPLTVTPKQTVTQDGKTFLDESAAPLPPIRAPWAMPALPKKEYKYRLPDPAGRKEIEYYRDPLHRGYLNYMVGEGEGPSLFYRVPKVLGGTYEAESGKKKVVVRTDRLF